jgi:cyclophilin family peptidyl-prolyl cis-trans isomerase
MRMFSIHTGSIRTWIFLGFILLFPFTGLYAQTPGKMILIKTTLGNIKITLYEETPLHAENFIKLVEEGFYDGQFFHRVINHFMIQAGDPTTRTAQPGEQVGSGGPEYTVPAEFDALLYHKKGAVASARQGDNVNPQRASSGSQFYIVQGSVLTEAQLKQMEAQNMHIPFTADQIKTYTTLGGTPHLDYAYTVFGEVVEGMDVVEKIASVQTDAHDRPVKDIKFTMEIID